MRTRRAVKIIQEPVWAIASAAFFLFALWIVVSTGLVPDGTLPGPGELLSALLVELSNATTWIALWDTIQSLIYGLALSIVFAIPLGLALGVNSTLFHGLRFTTEFLRPMPAVAIMPLVVIIAGTDITAKVVLIVFGTVFYIMLAVIYGVRDVERVSLDTARMYGLSAWEKYRYVILPAALPSTATGIRVATGIAILIAVSAEIVIATPGIGLEIVRAQESGALPRMYALVLMTGLLGLLINALIGAAERRVLVWTPRNEG